MPDLSSFLLMLKGGSGSGNHGHSGRLGKRGGSAPKSGGVLDRIPKGHLEGISKITTDMPPGGKYEWEGKDTAAYDPDNKVIYLSPNASDFTIAHEVGHHVIESNRDIGTEFNMYNIIGHIEIFGDKVKKEELVNHLQKAGVREYALEGGWQEFAADTYAKLVLKQNEKEIADLFDFLQKEARYPRIHPKDIFGL